ncbi:hypothetical protein [Halomicrococcus sp. SG-WS-1]|uniref:hypothetical protein n=1 Tax=Halomicrococcus sp. SG-WS-1 TaxID=3439057 RepID=UPI003F7A1DC7
MDGDLREVEWDVIVVPPETETPMDIRFYEGDEQIPLTDLLIDDETKVTEEETADIPREDENSVRKTRLSLAAFRVDYLVKL